MFIVSEGDVLAEGNVKAGLRPASLEYLKVLRIASRAELPEGEGADWRDSKSWVTISLFLLWREKIGGRHTCKMRERCKEEMQWISKGDTTMWRQQMRQRKKRNVIECMFASIA